jgi:hypothetical protein
MVALGVMALVVHAVVVAQLVLALMRRQGDSWDRKCGRCNCRDDRLSHRNASFDQICGRVRWMALRHGGERKLTPSGKYFSAGAKMQQ